MKQILFLLVVFFAISISCNSNKSEPKAEVYIDSLVVKSKIFDCKRFKNLCVIAKSEFENWTEYKRVDSLILTYCNISVFEALNNAEEMSKLVKNMKDTIRIEKLKKPEFIARINVLHNEALRLADMTTISSIRDDEVINKVNQIMDVFSALNTKVNILYEVEEFEKSLEVDTEEPLNIEEKSEFYEEKPEFINRKKLKAFPKKMKRERSKKSLVPKKTD